MTLTEAFEAGIRVVRTDAGHVVLREGEIRTPLDGQPPRVCVRRFRNDITVVNDSPLRAPTADEFFNDVPHIEREVDSVREVPDLIDGHEQTGKHVVPPTTPVYGRYVREHPFVSTTVMLLGLIPTVTLPGILTTVGYTLPEDYLPGQPSPATGPLPKDPHGQIAVRGDMVPSIVIDTIVALSVAKHPQVVKYRHDNGGTTYQVRGEDGEFGEQVLMSFGRQITARFRKLSLDCDQSGQPLKLTIHFWWSGPTRTKTF